MKIKVAITDDHPIVITGLRNIFAVHPDIVFAGAYQNGRELLDGLQHEQPDVLLLDIHLPDKTGDKLVPVILRKYPAVRIIALTSLESAFYIYNMLRAGVSGYLLKHSSETNIIEAIEKVYNGETYVEKELRQKMESFAKKMKSREKLKPSLTVKEQDVLKLTLQGYTQKEISEKLFMGQRTVEYYRTNLFLKFDARNIVELIRKALESGIMDEP